MILQPTLPRDAYPGVRPGVARLDLLRGHETILLVEDEPCLRALLQKGLRMFGYEVIDVPHPREALAVARAYPHKIHLLITDVVMPGVCGRQVAADLRKVFSSLKILFISGYSFDPVDEECDGEFLQKPFTATQLVTRVRRMLDGED